MVSTPFVRASVIAASIFLSSLIGSDVSAQQFVSPTSITINSANGLNPRNFNLILGTTDFNRDGEEDILAVYNWFMFGKYAVLLRQSDGTYTPSLLGLDQTDVNDTVRIADVNGDGIPDIVILQVTEFDDKSGTTFTNSLYVFLGKGDGRFTALPAVTLTPPPGQGPTAGLDLAVDLNGHGKPDLVLDFLGFPGQFTTGFPRTYQVFWNQGAGKFAAGPMLNVTGEAPLAYGDFNGDGYNDLVVPTLSGMQIYMNSSGKSFKPGAKYPIFESSVAVMDADRDGTTDLVVFDDGQNPTQHLAHVLLGNGDGTFHAGATFSYFGRRTGATPILDSIVPGPATVADINHNGIDDIALRVIQANVGFPEPSELMVLPGKGDGTFGAPATLNDDGAFLYSDPAPIFVDLDHDGKLELLTSAFARWGLAETANGTGGFLKAPRDNPSFVLQSITKGDFNRDGIADVAVVSDASVQGSYGEVLVYAGSGKGWFEPLRKYPIPMPSGVIAAGDVNGDGKLDLVVARSTQYFNHALNKSSRYDLCVLLGNGNGTFQSPKPYNVLGIPSNPLLTDYNWGYTWDNFVSLADVNHDGKPDLVGDWGVSLGKGDGTFRAPIALPSAVSDSVITDIAMGDINKDGNLDLAVVISSVVNTGDIPSSHLFTLLGDGKGSFSVGQEVASVVPLGSLTPIALADLDGDSNLDLLYFDGTTNIETQGLAVRMGKGNGSFGAAAMYTVFPQETILGSPLFSILVADFNRDGKQDVLLLAPVGTNPWDDPPTAPPLGSVTLLDGIGGGKLSAVPQYYPLTIEWGVVLEVDSRNGPDVAGISSFGLTRLLNSGSSAVPSR